MDPRAGVANAGRWKPSLARDPGEGTGPGWNARRREPGQGSDDQSAMAAAERRP